MVDEAQSMKPSVAQRIFYDQSEPRAGWRLLIFLALVIVFINIANFATRRLLHGAGESALFLLRESLDFLIFLLASWIMATMERRTIANYGLPWRRIFRLQFWQGALLGFGSITALLLAMRAAGVFHVSGFALHPADALKWALLWAFVFMLVALREEFRARGYALFTLSSGIGFWPATVISAAFFGYSHHGNSGEDWIGLANAGIFGLLACFLLRRTGDLWMPIGFHLTFDWGETYFYGVANSGNVLPGHLLNSASSGTAWLSGGSVGPEGSVLCTLMILLVWFLCSRWLRETKYPNFSRRS